MKYTSQYRKGNPIKKTSEYRSYTSMLDRCYRVSYKNYHRWGGRGITVCERWREPGRGFDNFMEDMGHKPTLKHQIDRIDNDKDYSPENCRWATQKEQMRNKHNTVMVEYAGQIWDIPTLADFLKIKQPTLRYRISKNIPQRYWGTHIRVPVSRPGRVLGSERIITWRGYSLPVRQWEEITGIPRYTIAKRISDYGYTVEKALTKSAKRDFSNAIMNDVISTLDTK